MLWVLKRIVSMRHVHLSKFFGRNKKLSELFVFCSILVNFGLKTLMDAINILAKFCVSR